MKLTKLFTAAAFVLAMCCSCKKDATVITPTPAPGNGKLLMKIVESSNTYVYEYNADRSAKGFSWFNGNYKMDIAYQPDKFIATYYNNGIKAGISVYELMNGIAQKCTSTNFDANGMATDVYVNEYTYNAKGQMEKSTGTKNGIYTGYDLYSYDSNNDLAKYESYDKNGVLAFKSEYEYDLAVLEKSGAFGQFQSNGTGLIFPKKAIHLRKKATQTYNGTVIVYTKSYTFDADGYVLTTTEKNNSNAIVDSETYTWQ
jgi:hypothetical protein